MEEMKKIQKELFENLLQKNVNDFTEQKSDGQSTLTYLSWSYAWQEFLKVCPDATYEIGKFADKNGNLQPYLASELGYMVFTSVTANGLTREMWLPVMDNKNKAMKAQPYKYTTRYGEKTVESATMFDVNKAIMRCLTKNLAMFGLGLYIYAGEDLPEEIKQPCTKEQIDRINELGCKVENVLKRYEVKKLEDLTMEQAQFVIDTKEKSLVKAE